MNGNELRIGTADGILVARLEGEIDLANAEGVRGALTRAASNEVVGAVIDLSKITYMDSAGINVLFSLRERLRVRGQEVRLVVPPGSGAYDALRYAGVLEALALSDSVDAALAELPAQVEFPGA
jgi:anti-anti-sigma factor